MGKEEISCLSGSSSSNASGAVVVKPGNKRRKKNAAASLDDNHANQPDITPKLTSDQLYEKYHKNK